MNATTTTETLELVGAQPAANALPTIQQTGALSATSPAALMLEMKRNGASIAEIGQMMDLQDRWERREAEKAFNDAMASFKGEAIEIIKRKRVHFVTQKGTTDYKHAELADVVEAVGPALSRHGFSWRWNTEQSNGHMTVSCILKHKLGHSESCSMTGPYDASGGKNALQAVISTKTYLERHTLKAICGVAEKGEDDDGTSSGGGGEAPMTWSAKAAAAETIAALNRVVKDGTVALQAAKDRDGYRDLREAARTRAAQLEGAGHA